MGKMEFKGFETYMEAKAYQKEHGGYLCYEERTPKRNKRRHTKRCELYTVCVAYGFLDRDKYDYALVWNIPNKLRKG